MPFRSERQRRYMWMKHPKIAKKWASKYGSKPSKKNYSKESMMMAKKDMMHK